MSSRFRTLLAYKSHAAGKGDHYTSLLPVGLGYLHAVLRSKGHWARLANFSAFSWKEVEATLRQERPDLLAISQFTHNRQESLRLAERAKRLNPSCFVVFGGPHATHCYRELLSGHRVVDAVVLGEGEDTLPDLVQCLAGRGDLTHVAGIAFMDGESVVHTAPRPPVMDLDSLPYPASSYGDAIGVDSRSQAEFIITSRGCPSACVFCSSPLFWGKALRFRSPRSVVDEIRFIRDRFGLIYFSIRDDTFTADRERVREFCRLLIQERLYPLWNCQSRVSAVDEETLEWMKRAGCECVQFGVESGSPAILRVLGKRITPEDVRRAAQAVRRAGINLSIYLISGVPGETDADLKATCDLIDDIRPMDGQVSPLAYYPGTALFRQAVRSGAVSADLFRQEAGEAMFVRTDSAALKAQRNLLKMLERVATKSAFSEKDFVGQKKRLGYCYTTNMLAGEMYELAGEERRAEAEYLQIAAEEPDNPWGWFALGELYAGQGKTRRARDAFEKVVEIVPSHLPAHALLGNLPGNSRVHPGKRS